MEDMDSLLAHSQAIDGALPKFSRPIDSCGACAFEPALPRQRIGTLLRHHMLPGG